MRERDLHRVRQAGLLVLSMRKVCNDTGFRERMNLSRAEAYGRIIMLHGIAACNAEQQATPIFKSRALPLYGPKKREGTFLRLHLLFWEVINREK